MIISLWKPYFLFKQGIKISAKRYFLPVLFRYIVTSVLFILTYYAFIPLHLEQISTIKDFIIDTIIVGLSCLIIGSGTFYILFSGTKDFAVRLKNISKLPKLAY